MDIRTNGIVRRPRVDAALLNSVSRTALAALTIGLALGVVLPGGARARCVVNPVQSVTFVLSLCGNPITFGSMTNIDPVSPSTAGVLGDSSMTWNISNYGSIRGGGHMGNFPGRAG